MAIDTLLTSDIARERVGKRIELPEGYSPRFKLWLPVPGSQGRAYADFEDTSFTFRVEGGVFDCSWEFDESSGLVRAVKGLREAQQTVGFFLPDTIVEHENISNAYKSAFDHMTIISYHEALEQRKLDFFHKINEGRL
jgi:hypothetical protein